MAQPVFIYGLYDPKTEDLRYVGKANDPEKRLKSHLRDMRRRSTPVYAWFKGLAEEGLVPNLKVLVECCEDTWPRHEIDEIKAARELGADLLNVAKGGKEPHCTMEVRRKNGAQIAKKRNKELWYRRQQLGIALKQGYVSEDLKQRMREFAAKHPDRFGDWLTI
tara:strand:- start:23209 stop:23700 length:492 start_codon:yes stop_codon:yes gene_type:complete